MVNFSLDFQDFFKKELKQRCEDMEKYELAYQLLEKHFSNFPLRIIPSKKHPLLLSGKYAKIPLELNNKLKEILPNERSYEFIKAEMKKTPFHITEDFFKLYHDLLDETQRLSEKERKLLESDHKNSL